MEIVMKKLSDIIPYERNPRKNDDAVQFVRESISHFGFKVPIVIDAYGVIVAGHTRYKAATQLKMKEVPCIVADDLTEEQVKAFRLADNKVSEQAEWDDYLLADELDEILGIDMGIFDFDTDLSFTLEEQHEEDKEKSKERAKNILDLERSQFAGVGKYDIPQIEPVSAEEIGEIKQWIGFNYVLSDPDPDGKAVHFFLDDYQFERLWTNPDKYIEKLRRYRCVLSPDFSPYADMPMATQIFNHYRKHWLAVYLQKNGVRIVPTVRASGDKRSFEWYLDGEPAGGVVCISSMWTSKDVSREHFMTEYNTMMEKLKPEKVFVYGKTFDELKGNIERIPTFAESRWN